MDTTAQRWAMLEPHVRHVGPDDDRARPAVLVYPYVGVAATGRFRAWRHCPKTLAIIAARDHLTTVRNAERVLDMACGTVEIERWTVDGTHAFDEPTGAGPMRHDEALTDEALARFAGFLKAALGA